MESEVNFFLQLLGTLQMTDSALCRGVLAHVEHPHHNGWVKIDDLVVPLLAEIVGAFIHSII